MPSRKFFKICCDGSVYYLLTTCSERQGLGITIRLTDTVNAWEGTVSVDAMTSWSNKTKMSLLIYEDLTRQALAAGSSADTSVQFEYELKGLKKKSSGVCGVVVVGEPVELLWKKVVASEDIKLQLGGVELAPVLKPCDVIKEIFDFSIESVGSCEQRISVLSNEQERIVQERSTLLEKLNQYATLKEDIEKDLYTKFVDVLNTKKEKLRQLKNQGCASDRGVGDEERLIMVTTSKQTSKERRTNKEEEDRRRIRIDNRDSSGDSDADTDASSLASNDRGETSIKKTDCHDNTSIKMSSRPHDNTIDDNLVLGDSASDDNDEPVTIKRPRKNAKDSGKKSVNTRRTSKGGEEELTIDKTRSSSSSSRGSLARASHSGASTSNLDASELLNNLA